MKLEIEVEYNIGDKFFILKNGKVEQHEVNALRIESSAQPGDNYSSKIITEVTYIIWGQSSYKGKDIFKTKELLLASL